MRTYAATNFGQVNDLLERQEKSDLRDIIIDIGGAVDPYGLYEGLDDHDQAMIPSNYNDYCSEDENMGYEQLDDIVVASINEMARKRAAKAKRGIVYGLPDDEDVLTDSPISNEEPSDDPSQREWTQADEEEIMMGGFGPKFSSTSFENDGEDGTLDDDDYYSDTATELVRRAPVFTTSMDNDELEGTNEVSSDDDSDEIDELLNMGRPNHTAQWQLRQ